MYKNSFFDWNFYRYYYRQKNLLQFWNWIVLTNKALEYCNLQRTNTGVQDFFRNLIGYACPLLERNGDFWLIFSSYGTCNYVSYKKKWKNSMSWCNSLLDSFVYNRYILYNVARNKMWKNGSRFLISVIFRDYWFVLWGLPVDLLFMEFQWFGAILSLRKAPFPTNLLAQRRSLRCHHL